MTTMMKSCGYGGGYSTAIDNAIKKLLELNINLLAIDFDQTFIDIHTGGRFQGTVSELVGHVRTELSQLVTAALTISSAASAAAVDTTATTSSSTGDDSGSIGRQQKQQQPPPQQRIAVAIVTFSSQIQLIKGVLEQSLGPELAAKIPIRGCDRSWSYCGVGVRDGKQAHIASAVEEILTNYYSTNASNSAFTSTGTTSNNDDYNITKATTLLIDDDRKNIRVALNDGTRAIWFNPDKPYLLLQDIAKLV